MNTPNHAGANQAPRIPDQGTQWYYGVGDQRVGPVAADSFIALIEAAQIRPESLVWRPGMSNWLEARQMPELAAALATSAHLRLASPPTAPTGAPVRAPETGDATGGVIPYKNAAALGAYYTGLFSIIPGAGLALGPIAVILGILGLRRAKANPLVKGRVHAWCGIILGGLVSLVYAALIVLFIIGAASR